MKLFKILSSTLLFLILSFIVASLPKLALSQGYLYCRTDSFGVCVKDLSVSPNPDCSPPDEFQEPDCSPYSDCCEAQNAGGSGCSQTQVACEPIDPAPECPENYVCTGLDASFCNQQGGIPGECSTSSGAQGICCQPSGCETDETCIDLTEEQCQQSGGTVQGCYLDNGSTANCCLAESNTCPQGYECNQLGGEATCDTNAGIYQSCPLPGGGTGDCCTWSAGTYCCEWDGIQCYNKIGGGVPCPYSCMGNFGPCQEDDPDCTACSEFTTAEECTDGNWEPGDAYEVGDARLCTEQNETVGYYCDGVFGCQPCFEWNQDPDSQFYIPSCDPPDWGDYSSCNLACSGQVQSCIGVETNQEGGCFFGYCPEGTYIDGTNPPNDNCSKYHYCCIPLYKYPPPAPPGPLDLDCESNGIAGINSAIGCIPVETNIDFVAFIIRFATGIAGGISFILIIYSGFMITTSAGNPERVQAGKELLTAAIAGLMLIIFSVFLLDVVGVRIFQLPGF